MYLNILMEENSLRKFDDTFNAKFGEQTNLLAKLSQL